MIRRVLLALACTILVHGPALGEPVRPSRAEPEQITLAVRWHESRTELVQFCLAAGAWSRAPRGTQPVGCTLYYPEREHCEVHALRPERVDDARTAVFGHEVLHCFMGAYHEPQ